jgi:hypothetical protein
LGRWSGDRAPATIEVLTEIAEKTGNAKVLHAVRYLTGEAVGKADMARTCQYVR